MVIFESGSRISSFGEEAFYMCESLGSICIPPSVETIARICFDGCPLEKIILAVGSKLSDQSMHDMGELGALALTWPEA
jgi:hypothetical protein